MNSVEDDSLMQLSQQFEDWLYNAYPELLMQSNRELVLNVRKRVTDLLESGTVVLWAFIDNLSLLWNKELLEAMDAAKLYVEVPEFVLAMLPTTTEVSRPSLLLGFTPKQAATVPGGNDWEKFREVWSDEGYIVEETNNIRQLSELAGQGPDLLLFRYGRLDDIMHSHIPDISQRLYEIRSHLEHLFDSLSNTLNVLSQFGHAVLIVSTDHGSTNIYKGHNYLKIPAFAEKDPYLEKHRRYVKMSSAKLNDAQWFVLDQDTFELPSHYAVPKGFISVEAHPQGLTHGGLTPEEVVIPAWICHSGERISEYTLDFKQVSSPLRLVERAQGLVVEVYNPLDVDLINLRAFLPELFTEFEPVTQIQRGSTATTKANVSLSSFLNHKADVLETELAYTAAQSTGRVIENVITIELNIQRLYSTEIDDMFEDF